MARQTLASTGDTERASGLEVLSRGEIPFEADVRLLQELGERLVAAPEVAILELVKNARDADAEHCEVRLVRGEGKNEPRLIIADSGCGMDEDDFRHRWMRIATESRRDTLTARYRRPVTGQKGIGRFAVRFLGNALRLESVKQDRRSGTKTSLVADFDWSGLDRKAELAEARVPYSVFRESSESPTGTQLIISGLRLDPGALDSRAFLTSLLRIVSPGSSFDAGRFARDLVSEEKAPGDPGFSVRLAGFSNLPGQETDVATQVLDRAWARLRIDLSGERLVYELHFRDQNEPQKLPMFYANSIGEGLHADIAFFPRRQGMFQGTALDGRQCWGWVRDNSGVGVIDHGFRIRPYGFEDDDWLYLGIDHAHNRREWRSTVARKSFPITDAERTRPALSPALNLPSYFQLVGAVFVSSRPVGKQDSQGLIPSMDREGFLHNQAFEQLCDVVRGGLEYLAKADKALILAAQEQEAKAALKALREDLRQAAEFIQRNENLSHEEKAALTKHYSRLASQVEAQEQYDREARTRLEVAAGLGVVAGFMTHESERLFMALDRAIAKLAAIARRDTELAAALETVRDARSDLDGYIGYTRLYIDSLKLPAAKAFKAAPQVELIVQRFGQVAERRGVQTEVSVADDVMVPAIPVALYSAVILNLYTNAVKAIIARSVGDRQQKIAIRAWNDERRHHVDVCDTGVGVPPQLRERAWDPFFTTTSAINSPLGSGMGLGLPLVRNLLSRVKGTAEFIDPPPGFSTCVRVTIARDQHG